MAIVSNVSNVSKYLSNFDFIEYKIWKIVYLTLYIEIWKPETDGLLETAGYSVTLAYSLGCKVIWKAFIMRLYVSGSPYILSDNCSFSVTGPTSLVVLSWYQTKAFLYLCVLLCEVLLAKNRTSCPAKSVSERFISLISGLKDLYLWYRACIS